MNGTNLELEVARHPDTVLAEASLVANSVDRLVKNRPDLVQVIAGRRHPRFELLQIVGSMFRVTVRVVETRHFTEPDGWEATAEAVHIPTGQILARGEGMCTTDEPSWHMRPKYEWRNGKREKVGEEPVTSHQRRSMAQTRACSKALRLALGWVLGLAGYEATAAEELPEDDAAPAPQVRRRSQRQTVQAQQPAPSAEAQRQTISPDERSALWASARDRGLSDEQVAAIIGSYGYTSSRDIRCEHYRQIMSDIAQAKPETKPTPQPDQAA